MQSLIHEMAGLILKGDSFTLATVISRTGSAPREVGACMLLRQDGSTHGSVGGGPMEAQALVLAQKVLISGQLEVMVFEFSGKNAADSNAICGGRVEVLLERWDAGDTQFTEVVNTLQLASATQQKAWLVTSIPKASFRNTHTVVFQDNRMVGASLIGITPEQIIRFSQPGLIETDQGRVLISPLGTQGVVYIFGAGHVGKSLAEFTTAVGFRTVVLDDRLELTTRPRFPSADRLVVLTAYSNAFDSLEIDENSYIVILTHGHQHDQEVLTAALHTRAGYIGMIGSRRKVKLVFDELRSEGFSEADIQRIHAPIGLAIEAETPEEIGVSIVAEMIKVRARLNQVMDQME